MEMQAEVTGVEEGYVLVKVSGEGGCGRCNETGGCNSGVLTQIFGRKSCRIFRLPNAIGAAVGDQVVLSVADGVTLKTALAVYMVPVLMVLLGAALGTWWGEGQDLPALAGLLAGLLLSVAFVALFRRRMVAQGSGPMLARRADALACSQLRQ